MGGQIHHRLHAAERGDQRRAVKQADRDRVRAGLLQSLGLLGRAGAGADFVPALAQGRDEPPADDAGRPGDEYLHAARVSG